MQKREIAVIYAAKSGWRWAMAELAEAGMDINYQDEVATHSNGRVAGLRFSGPFGILTLIVLNS